MALSIDLSLAPSRSDGEIPTPTPDSRVTSVSSFSRQFLSKHKQSQSSKLKAKNLRSIKAKCNREFQLHSPNNTLQPLPWIAESSNNNNNNNHETTNELSVPNTPSTIASYGELILSNMSSIDTTSSTTSTSTGAFTSSTRMASLSSMTSLKSVSHSGLHWIDVSNLKKEGKRGFDSQYHSEMSDSNLTPNLSTQFEFPGTSPHPAAGGADNNNNNNNNNTPRVIITPILTPMPSITQSSTVPLPLTPVYGCEKSPQPKRLGLLRQNALDRDEENETDDSFDAFSLASLKNY